jgi:hypothetical protein
MASNSPWASAFCSASLREIDSNCVQSVRSVRSQAPARRVSPEAVEVPAPDVPDRG